MIREKESKQKKRMTKIRLIHHQHTVILQMDYEGLALYSTKGTVYIMAMDWYWIKLQLQSDFMGKYKRKSAYSLLLTVCKFTALPL